MVHSIERERVMRKTSVQTQAEVLLQKMNHVAAKWGVWVSRWPTMSKLIAFLLFVTTASGILKLKFEKDVTVLYCPESSVERKAWEKYRSRSKWTLNICDRHWFEVGMHANGNNVLTPEGIGIWNSFMEGLNNTWILDMENVYDPLRMQYYYKDHFDNNIILPTNDEDFWFPWQTNDTWLPAIRYGAPLTASMIGKAKDSDGNELPYNSSSLVDTAEVLLASWKDVDFPIEMIETCKSLAAELNGDFQFVYFSAASVGHEMLQTFLNDAPKILGAIILLFLFCAGFVWRRDRSRNKTMVVLSAIGASFMAIISAFGFGLGIGYPKHISQIVMFIPFLILAIGMDDMFVLIRSYELSSPMLVPEMRIATCMHDGGISITITSLSNLVAFFGGGLMIDMPAISDLCFFASYGIFFLYIYTITLVLSVVVCQARREEKENENCCACHFCGSTLTSVRDAEVSLTQVDFARRKTVDRVERIGTIPPHFTRFLTRNVAKSWWRISVFTFSVGYLVLATIGALKLFNRIGLDYVILAPRDSFLVDWYHARGQYLDEVAGQFAYIVVDDESCNYQDEGIKDALVSIYESMGEVECILADLGDSWISRIENCMTVGCVDSCTNSNWTTCYNWFQNIGTWFTENGTSGDFFSWRGTFFDTQSKIPKATQWMMKMRADEIYSFDRIECLDGIWSRLEGAPCNMIAFNDVFPFFAGDKTAVPGTWQTMIFAMISCLCLCLIFIPSITVVGIIVFCIGFLLMGLLGITYWIGYRLDSVTQTLFIMGIGFAVDFTVHVSHSYLQAKGSRVDKVVIAIQNMGEAVFLAAASTILGVALLYTSTSSILVNLATMLSVIMVIGVYISGILLPTILACIGPNNPPSRMNYIESVSENDDVEMTKKMRTQTPPTNITPELN